jgi:hypothetical protein
MVSFASSSSVNFDCPSEVEVNEEFSCSLEVNEGEGIYDVKVEIEKEGQSIAKIFKLEDDKFISTYYYLKEFINVEEKKEILLKVGEGGTFDMILKLRKGDSIEFFEYELNVGGESNIEENNFNNEDVEIEEDNNDQIEEEKIIFIKKEKETISLNSNSFKESPSELLIYESKNSRNLHYLSYAFSLFLMIILGILLWEKF